MAIEKAIETETSATAAYWRIVEARFDLIAGTIYFIMAGYVSAAAREAGKAALTRRAFLRSIPEGMTPEQLTRSALYGFVMQSPEFEGALDV